MRLLVLSSLLCILLLFFPVEGRRHPIRSQRVWRCCPVARPLRTILKGRYAGPCRLCKIKPSLIHQWVVPGALPQV
uniref:G protein-coupled receptor 15 ligand n=1 Tax=Oryctolagus cuniculus TaxID=9986 RepID=A0A5F9DI79_RABIT